MSVRVYSVFVLSCVYVAALRRADLPSKEAYRVFIDQETEKAAKVHKVCRSIDRFDRHYSSVDDGKLRDVEDEI
jgi:hypothetical protein